MSADLHPVVYKAEALLLERRLAAMAHTFRIVHRFGIAGAYCQDGEEVFAVELLHRGRQFHVALPLALRFIFDYLARHTHTPQSATQIASGISASSFYRDHGLNSGVASRRKISRNAVKEYIKRIRETLAITLRQAGVAGDPTQILVSHSTRGNEVLYRLRATIVWAHCDDIRIAPTPQSNCLDQIRRDLYQHGSGPRGVR